MHISEAKKLTLQYDFGIWQVFEWQQQPSWW